MVKIDLTKFSSSLDQFKKKSKTKKVKAKAKKKATKKVAKKEAPEVVRPSPFEKGDEVWFNRGNMGWQKTKITKCNKPERYRKEWRYDIMIGTTLVQLDEDQLLPAKIFTLMATDVIRLKDATFTTVLNDTFDEEIRILAAYRAGHSRPWAYYVIPDETVLYKTVKWTYKQYSYQQNGEAVVYVRPVKDIKLQLTPISSAPQEILTYLGNRIYNRKWKSEQI
jgi:hypothetical protein